MQKNTVKLFQFDLYPPCAVSQILNTRWSAICVFQNTHAVHSCIKKHISHSNSFNICDLQWLGHKHFCFVIFFYFKDVCLLQITSSAAYSFKDMCLFCCSEESPCTQLQTQLCTHVCVSHFEHFCHLWRALKLLTPFKTEVCVWCVCGSVCVSAQRKQNRIPSQQKNIYETMATYLTWLDKKPETEIQPSWAYWGQQHVWNTARISRGPVGNRFSVVGKISWAISGPVTNRAWGQALICWSGPGPGPETSCTLPLSHRSWVNFSVFSSCSHEIFWLTEPLATEESPNQHGSSSLMALLCFLVLWLVSIRIFANHRPEVENNIQETGDLWNGVWVSLTHDGKTMFLVRVATAGGETLDLRQAWRCHPTTPRVGVIIRPGTSGMVRC